MIKVLTVLGARPQFIKAAALSKAISNTSSFRETIIHTGQHFDVNMSRVFFEEMGIPEPKYNLDVHSQNHGAMTGNMLIALEKVMLRELPDLVIVYGDTNSTLAGALAASKLHIPVAHIEAGLRSRNMKMPEEINRVITDRISSYLFCPSAESVHNLISEGMPPSRVFDVGDIMLDSLILHRQKADSQRTQSSIGIKGPYLLATIHRQENLRNTERLNSIFNALIEINRSTQVVLPVHPALKSVLPSSAAALKLIEPQSYLNLLGLLVDTSLVFTDSGGLQKEAYYMQKHCITLRDETEWVELVDAGVNKLVGADSEAILCAFNALIKKEFAASPYLFGEGETAIKILNILRANFD